MSKTSIAPILVVALIAYCGFVPDARAAPRVRKNIKDLNAADQQRFVDAMFALQNPANFTPVGGWPANTDLPQNRYELFVAAHDTNGTHIHHTAAARSNPIFLPWHRQFLFQLENDVRSLGAIMVPDSTASGGMRAQDFSDFTLPYWDGTRDAHPDSAVGGNGDLTGGTPTYNVTSGPFATTSTQYGTWTAYTRTGAGTGGDPFVYSRGPLKRQFGNQNPAPTNAGDPVQGSFTDLTNDGPASLAALLAAPNYSDLLCKDGVSGLEAAPGLHDQHHVQVGGLNGQVGNPQTGTVDPTFWLLHTFTDLQWARWESTKGLRYDDLGEAKWRINTPMPAGLTELNDQNIYGHDPGTTGNAQGSVTPGDVLNYWTMPGGGYTYDYRPNPRLKPDGTPHPNAEDRVMLGAPVPEPATLLLGVMASVVVISLRRHWCG